ncbi:MAG: bifunctional phosphopantothenoylcysteine decarboxylase/phosphopantothenate--cysteine ligase CoaBC [Candidatus Cloacimonetes bacterium]|nr:bifunctional phosphopantothenoylcysteine decarboxylase/phosphopantothenate--cysteine ligase CoaBC [Candidatus Cloacimonadota bacterium]
MLEDRKILVAVTGGIAAFKAISLCSMLKKQGAEVRVILTDNALRFVSPLSFSAITRHPVATTLWKENGEIPHIDLADWADIIVIAPATANIIAKCAHGIADDLLSSTFLAVTGPVLFVPAMNVHMLENPATQANLALLKQRGCFTIEPEHGILACGYEGKGRYPENEEILYYIRAYLQYTRDWAGKKVMITAGACRESIDPMRYISNRSSGKMGLALARAASIRGAEVTLITADVTEIIPAYLPAIKVSSAAEMYDACLKSYSNHELVIMAAAVSDYRPTYEQKSKIKKGENLQLELVRTKDIISEMAQKKNDGQIICGFAAESENIIEYAREKMLRKGLDCIIANNLKVAGAAATNCHFISPSLEMELSGDKFDVALQILDLLKTIGGDNDD